LLLVAVAAGTVMGHQALEVLGGLEQVQQFLLLRELHTP